MSTLIEAFDKLFDDSDYTPHPISLMGANAYFAKIPRSCCPFTDSENKELWEHGWDVTDIGHIKAAGYGDVYDDPINWK